MKVSFTVSDLGASRLEVVVPTLVVATASNVDEDRGQREATPVHQVRWLVVR